MPLFSVIVPVYNVEEYLEECVKSVLNQSCSDFELILVDDGSTDGSPELCDGYAAGSDKISVIHKHNGGLSDARNAGLNVCKGKYILFLDSDDYWNDPNALEQLNQIYLSENPDVIIFGCTDWNMQTGKTVVSRNGYDLDTISTKNYNSIIHYLFSSKMIPGGATIFCVKREIIEDNGIRFKTGIQDEDYDYVLSVFTSSSSVSAINNPFYLYRKGRSSSITGSSNIKMIEGIAYTLDKWLPICEKYENETVKKDLLNYLAFIYTTGFVVSGRMNREKRKKALSIMKKYKSVLQYGYWRKTKIIRLASGVLGFSLFSRLSSIYFKLTHI